MVRSGAIEIMLLKWYNLHSIMNTIDQRWFGEYTSLASYVDGLEPAWRAPIAAQKEAFFGTGCLVNPDLRPEVDTDEIGRQDGMLRSLQERIGDLEGEGVIRRAYLPKIDEQRKKLAIFGAAHSGDADAFIEASVDVFDEPDHQVFGAVAAFFTSQAAQLVGDGDPRARNAADRVLCELPTPSEVADSPWLSTTEFDQLKDLFGGFFGRLLGNVELPETLRGETALSAARLIMSNLGYRYEVVPQASGVAYMEVKHAAEEVRIPLTAQYTRDRFVALMGHEVGIHVEERIAGEAEPLALVAVGLDRFIRAGEGKGTLVEGLACSSYESFMETKRFADLARRYLAVGLARGTDGNGPRDFVEVFRTLNAVDEMRALASHPADTEMALQKAGNATWALLATRSLRGWCGRGTASLKEKDYLQGSKEQGGLLLARPRLFPHINRGKHDLTNARHIEILTDIGTLPPDITTV
jgi:hypothetical protein